MGSFGESNSCVEEVFMGASLTSGRAQGGNLGAVCPGAQQCEPTLPVSGVQPSGSCRRPEQ